jgi:RHS repeat-associated protein
LRATASSIAGAGTTSYTYLPDSSIASIANDSTANLNLPTGSTTFGVDPISNRLTNATGALARVYQYDSVGNTLSDGVRTFTYDSSGRMGTAQLGIITSYAYNALGQRVRKSNANGTTYFVYDEAGHLLGEYDQAGALIQELVWLGDIPVASIRTNDSGNGVGVFYIHTDHLNAPTKLTRSTDNAIVWRWDHDPFGNGAPNDDPDGNGLFLTFNLRFPGQYFDAETGLHYNYFRYFDPQSGRYITSDPIGLEGGLNTYAYAYGNPLSIDDPFGLRGPVGGAGTAVPRGVRIGVYIGLLDGPEPFVADFFGAVIGGTIIAYDKCKEDCSDILANIYRLMTYLDGKHDAMLLDKCNLYNLALNVANPSLPGGCADTTWAGHAADIEMRQNELAKWIRKAIANNCPVPPGAMMRVLRRAPNTPRGWFPGRGQ